MQLNEKDIHVEQWKIKHLIAKLENAKGVDNSLISLIVPPRKSLSDVLKSFDDKINTTGVSEVESSKEPLVMSIKLAKEKIGKYDKTPRNGLVLYVGTVYNRASQTEREVIAIDFEPFKLINKFSVYYDNKFHLEDIKPLLIEQDIAGFVVFNETQAVIATVQNNTREIICENRILLPKQPHGVRSHYRKQAIKRIIHQTMETAAKIFITNKTSKASGIVIAGTTEFLKLLTEYDRWDPKLKLKLLKMINIPLPKYGLEQVIDLSQENLVNIRVHKERMVLSDFYQKVVAGPEMVVYGADNTMKALEKGIIRKIILYEELDCWRVTLKDQESEKISFRFYTSDQLDLSGLNTGKLSNQFVSIFF